MERHRSSLAIGMSRVPSPDPRRVSGAMATHVDAQLDAYADAGSIPASSTTCFVPLVQRKNTWMTAKRLWFDSTVGHHPSLGQWPTTWFGARSMGVRFPQLGPSTMRGLGDDRRSAGNSNELATNLQPRAIPLIRWVPHGGPDRACSQA